MVKKRKYNNNTYSFGGGFKEGVGDFDITSFGKGIGQNLGGIASAVGGAVGGLIGNGYESGVGSALSTIGDIGGMIPGPWGAAIGAGAKILGGVANAAFGTKVDQEKLNAAKAGISALSGFKSDAENFDDVTGPVAVTPFSNPYKSGFLNRGKARKKNAELRNQFNDAMAFAGRSVENNIDNIASNQMSNSLANFYSFGGPFDFTPITGAIDYEIAQRRLAQKDLEAKKSLGGPLHSNGTDWSNGIILVDQGGTHEENPLGGVQMGIASDGQPNLVEEGEVIYNDYVFSNRLKVPDDVRKTYKLRGDKDMTFADAARKVQKSSAERPNDVIEKRSLEDIMGKLMMAQEEVRTKKNKGPEGVMFRHGGHLFAGLTEPTQKMSRAEARRQGLLSTVPIMATSLYGDNGYGNEGIIDYYYEPYEGVEPSKVALRPLPSVTNQGNPNPVSSTFVSSGRGVTDLSAPRIWGNSTTRKNDERGKRNWATGLRYAPALGAAIGVTTDLLGLTNKPDYSNADLIMEAANNIGTVSPMFIGDYLTYKPFDRLFYANQLGAQAGAARRSIMNTSGGNRGAAMTGLIASDYNAQNQLGNLFRQAEEYNLGQRERVAAFNRGTNQFNSDIDLKSQIANLDRDKMRLSAVSRAAAIRDAVDARVSAARSANLTNLFNSLGAIGEDEINRMDARWLAPLIYGVGADRAPSLGGVIKRWSANGGKITKRKKGLTYG